MIAASECFENDKNSIYKHLERKTPISHQMKKGKGRETETEKATNATGA